MNRYACPIAVFFLLIFTSSIRGTELKPGDSPPPLSLEKLLQAPAGSAASWEKLRGKVVVLEFWATWCGPCVKAIPHLNELADEFKGKPVEFIAITSENEQIVKNFLERQPIKAWIGMDAFQETKAAYGVTGIPVTVVVNQQGIIADVTHPIHLTGDRIREIMAGKIMPKPPAKADGAGRGGDEVVKADQAPSLFEVSIKPSRPRVRGRGIGMWSSGGEPVDITGAIASVESAVHTVYHLGAARIVNKTAWPKGDFDFCLRLPGASQEVAETLFNHALRSTFGLEAVRQTQEMDVYVLSSTTNRHARGLKPVSAPGGGGSGLTGYDSSGAPVSSVAGVVEAVLRRPVLDETKLEGNFEIHLTWELSERSLAIFQLNRSVAAALESDSQEEPASLDENDKKILRAIRGIGSEEEFKTLPEKTQRLCQVIREELSKPEDQRFLPEPEAVIKAVREKLGLELTLTRRTVELVTVQKGSD